MIGKTNNPNGRPVGAVGKSTTEIKQWVKQLLEANQAQFNADLMQVDSMQRLQVMTSLLKYAIPTLSSVSVEAQIQAEYLQLKELLDSASPEAIELISKKIISLNEQNQ